MAKQSSKIGPFGTICNIHCWYYNNPIATSFNGVGNMPTTLSVQNREHRSFRPYRKDQYSNRGGSE